MPTNTYPKEVWFDIETLVNVAQPHSIVTLGDFDTTFLSEFRAQKKVLGQPVLHEDLSLSAERILTSTAHYDLAIVANLIERIPKSEALRILSRLRDINSAQFCVCLTLQKDHWHLTDLFALGLQRVSEYHQNGSRYALFKYNLSEYKKTPDWLNSDNWANPEMWGKYSW